MSTFEQVLSQQAVTSVQNSSVKEKTRTAPAFVLAALTPTLPLQIADQIGTVIVEERFAPGERLKEVDLAEAFGVSRATVREALRILENRGLVRILPQRGAQVTLLSRVELENLFEIRAALLGLSARHAALRFDPSNRRTLDARFATLGNARDDAGAYARASAEMVEYVARLSGNEQLVEMITGFAQRIGRYTRLGLALPERRTQSVGRWRRVVHAITTADAAAAEESLRLLALENRDAALVEIGRRAAASKKPRKRAG